MHLKSDGSGSDESWKVSKGIVKVLANVSFRRGET